MTGASTTLDSVIHRNAEHWITINTAVDAAEGPVTITKNSMARNRDSWAYPTQLPP
eukprot:CAMPEP_0201619856 /NCGR_PEP_ID=MMETSP0492-20130828/42640_1 /ASSEMBLY_ACC=CAM_ASM_000837 /TAXON_ID=420259 /ORGANISM="Thalassiosira gravida, Strain GMp14c1" /LENGTH=55 /DNA_ID=CAMNT_0048088859 /DNA_START=424 /DNA_END=591 /DNA_ORIENTATION=-